MLATDRKVKVLEEMWKCSTDVEKSLIMHDLTFYFKDNAAGDPGDDVDDEELAAAAAAAAAGRGGRQRSSQMHGHSHNGQPCHGHGHSHGH